MKLLVLLTRKVDALYVVVTVWNVNSTGLNGSQKITQTHDGRYMLIDWALDLEMTALTLLGSPAKS